MSSPTLQSAADTWWRTAVVYQIYPRSFADSNGDGIGDLRGIIGKLDHLAGLGVDVLWLSPIYPSPQDDNGYDISDYQNIEPTFGTLADFDELLARAHARGLKILMDLVVNHTSDEHPWFVEARSSTDNPKRDWYWWRPRPEHGGVPNNWGSHFSGSAWELDPATDEYYLHLFTKKQPDLNWENPEVRSAVHTMMNWWLDRGVDGFRMDVINMVSKDVTLPDGPLAAGELFSPSNPGYINGPRLHEFLQEMHREVFAGRPDRLLTVGETPSTSVAEARLMTDPARNELDMVFQFEHVDLDHGPGGRFDPQPLDLVSLKTSLNRWQVGLAETGWNSLYWNNHDQPRIVSRWGDDRAYWAESAKLLGIVLHLHRGTPYIYQGEEIGMTNMPWNSIAELDDVQSVNYHREALALLGRSDADVMTAMRAQSRDNARTPVQWSDAPHGGFTTGEPWLAVNPNFSHLNAAAQVDDPDSIHSFYRQLVELRHTEPLVTDGVYTLLLPRHPQLFVFTRTTDDAGLLVLANFSGSDLTVPDEALDGWKSAEPVLANYPIPADSPGVSGPPAQLRPWESVVVRR